MVPTPTGSSLSRLGLALVAAVLVAGACGRSAPADPQTAAPAASSPPAAAEEAPTTASGQTRFGIAFLGDSITAGYGLTTAQAYPNLVEQMFAAEGYSEVEIVNNGLSGDTTAGGLRRVPESLEPGVRIVVVALGGNDALRGLSAAQTKQNLTQIIEAIGQRGVGILLVGMQAPTNLGLDYQAGFRDVFMQLAAEYRGRIGFVPFLLEGVAGQAALNQADGIHPNEAGQKVIAELLYPALRRMVDEMSGGPGRE